MAKKNLISEGTRILSEGTTMAKKEETHVDRMIGLFVEYATTIDAIMSDYVSDPAMIAEIQAKTAQLLQPLNNMFGALEGDWKARCKQLEDLGKEIKDLKEEVDERDDTIKDLRSEIDDLKDEVKDLEKEVEELEDKKNDEGDIVIKAESLSMVQRDQIEAFLSSIIFPHYNQQVANLNF